MTSYIFNCWYDILVQMQKHFRNDDYCFLFRREIYHRLIWHLVPPLNLNLYLLINLADDFNESGLWSILPFQVPTLMFIFSCLHNSTETILLDSVSPKGCPLLLFSTFAPPCVYFISGDRLHFTYATNNPLNMAVGTIKTKKVLCTRKSLVL